MARRKSKAGKAATDPSATVADAAQIERFIKLFALLVVKGESQPDKIRALSGAGFTNTEIANLLGMKANAVNQAVHRLRSNT